MFHRPMELYSSEHSQLEEPIWTVASIQLRRVD